MTKLLRRYFGKVHAGRLVLARSDRVLFLADCNKYKDGTKVWLSVSIARKIRSNQQNAFYFGVIVPILADEFGYSKEEMHEALKWKFLRIPGDDGKLDTVKSTAKLTTTEFEEHLDAIREWANTNFDLYLPFPNEVTLPEYLEIYE